MEELEVTSKIDANPKIDSLSRQLLVMISQKQAIKAFDNNQQPTSPSRLRFIMATTVTPPNTESSTNAVEVWDRIQPSHSTDDFVEVTWSGKKLLLKRSQLDAWFHEKPFEEKVDYVKTHPFTVQIPVHKFQAKFDPKEELFDPDDYVLIHWSGKDLLLEKDMLEKWYDMPYEMHADYVRRHPDNILDSHNTDTSLVGMLDDET